MDKKLNEENKNETRSTSDNIFLEKLKKALNNVIKFTHKEPKKNTNSLERFGSFYFYNEEYIISGIDYLHGKVTFENTNTLKKAKFLVDEEEWKIHPKNNTSIFRILKLKLADILGAISEKLRT